MTDDLFHKSSADITAFIHEVSDLAKERGIMCCVVTPSFKGSNLTFVVGGERGLVGIVKAALAHADALAPEAALNALGHVDPDDLPNA